MSSTSKAIKKRLKRNLNSLQSDADTQNKQLKEANESSSSSSSSEHNKPKTLSDFPALKKFMETHKLITLEDALFRAIKDQNVDILQNLLSLHVYLKKVDNEGNLPLQALLSNVLDSNQINDHDEVTYKPFKAMVNLLLDSNTQTYLHHNAKGFTTVDIALLLERRTKNKDIVEALELIMKDVRAIIPPYLLSLKNREFRDYNRIIAYQFSNCHRAPEMSYRLKEIEAKIKVKLEDPIIEQITDSYKIGFGLAQFNKNVPFLLPDLRSLVMEYCGNKGFAQDAYKIGEYIPFFSNACTELYNLIHSTQIIPKPFDKVKELLNENKDNGNYRACCAQVSFKDGITTYAYYKYEQVGDYAEPTAYVESTFSVLPSCKENFTVLVNSKNSHLNTNNFLCLEQYRLYLASKDTPWGSDIADAIDEPNQHSAYRYFRL